jgi:phage terminase large subunit
MNEKDTNEFILDLKLPGKLVPVFTGEARYRGAYGGRGSAKSWSFADMALLRAYSSKTRILCTRELQNSIKASVLQILIDRLEAHGLGDFFDYGESYLRSILFDEHFLFKGLRHNYREIKSTEGIDICWVEEAETTSEESFRVLLPTVRKPGSEIWLTWNSESHDAPIHKRFVMDPPDNAKIVKMNYVDNPWFPEELEQERLADQKRDPDVYAHVWEGECLTRTDAQVLGGKWRVADFKMPAEVDGGPYYGCDWGFSSDPLALVRCFINGNRLYIDYEAGEKGIEIKDTPATFDEIPGIKKHMVRADNARPELISHMQTEGYRCVGADKWPGSVEDGITHLRSYDEIIIHERCVKVAKEARLWSYKIDKQTGDILPVLIDANNHWMDGVRYALAPIIRKKKFTGRAAYAGQFNEILHVSLDELWPIKGHGLVIGFAAKQTTQCAVIAQVNISGQLRIIEEVIVRNSGVSQFATSVLQPLLRGKYRGCHYEIVSFKAASSSRTTDNDANLIIDEIEEAGLTIESVDSDLLGRRMEAVRWYFNQLSGGRPAITISPSCTVLRDGLAGGYQFRQMEIQGTDDIRYSDKPDDNQYVLPNQALQYICQFQRGEFESNKIQPVVSGYRTYT